MKTRRVQLDAAKAGAYHDADAAEWVRLSMGIGNSAPIGAAGDPAGFATPVDDAAYRRFYPYHAEICALSELKKKPGSEEFLARLRTFRGTLPADFTFDRDDANGRG